MATDYGLPAGLAYRHDWNAASNNDKYLHALKKQSEIDKMNKAKLFTDDIEFGRANNKWDQNILKGFSETKIRELGAYVSSNPDYLMDPEKLFKVKRMKNELINNPTVERAMRVDQHYKTMFTYLSDPKNAHMRNDPMIMKSLQDYDNYSRTGSADGNGANGIEFSFLAPEEAVDTEKILQEFASKTEYDGTGGAAGQGGFSQFVTSGRRQNTANSVLDNANYGRYLLSDWNKLSEGEQKQFGSINKYVAKRMDPYFKSKTIKNGVFFKPDTKGLGDNGAAENPWKKDVLNPLIEAKNKGLHNHKVSVNPGLAQTVITDHKGNIDLRRAQVVVPGSDDVAEVNLGQRKAQATGKFGVRGNGKDAYMTSEVSVDFYPEEYGEVFGEDAIDALGLNNLPFTSLDEYDDFKIRSGYDGLFEKIQDEDGKPKVRAYIEVPMRGETVSAAAMYNKQIGAKAFDTSRENAQDVTVSDDGRWIWNGESWAPNE